MVPAMPVQYTYVYTRELHPRYTCVVFPLKSSSLPHPESQTRFGIIQTAMMDADDVITRVAKL